MQTLVTTHQAPYDAPVTNPDIHRMRETFRALTDECVPEIYRAGLDFDDTIIHRFALCKTPGNRVSSAPSTVWATATRVRRTSCLDFFARSRLSISQLGCGQASLLPRSRPGKFGFDSLDHLLGARVAGD